MTNNLKHLLTAFLPLLLAGCIDDDYKHWSYTDPIQFSTSVDNVATTNQTTRAAYNETTFSEFQVTALGNAAAYFQNLKVTKQTDGSWVTASTKYWPAYPLKFFGYAPASLQSKIAINTSEQKLTGYSPAKAASSQADIVTAFVHANQNSASGTAVLGFHHALSQIEVLARNGEPSKYTIEVLGVKLCVIPSTADLTFQTASDAYPLWSTATGSEDYILKGNTSFTLTSTSQRIMFGTDNFLLVPQTLAPWTNGATADGAYISVLCRITDELGNCIYPDDPTKFGFAALPIDQVWQSGHKYTYTVSFFTNGGGAGRIDPNAVNPDDPTDPDIDVTPGGTKPGGSLVVPDSQVPIEVSVSITDWVNGSSDNIDLEF